MGKERINRLVMVNGKRVGLTEKEHQVVKVLRTCKEWVGPTQIGETLGKPYDKASAWAGPALRRLVAIGVAERSDETPNKGKYRLIKSRTYQPKQSGVRG